MERTATSGVRLTIAMLMCALASTCGADRERADKQCANEDAQACHELGVMQIHGIGGPKKRKSGRLQLERACELGHAASCGLAGDLSYARRDARARRFLKRGCEIDDAESCVDLGWMVEHGEGGPADRQAAQDYYRKACDSGHASGCFLLGLSYRSSPLGGSGDRSEMLRYLRRACKLGDEYACKKQQVNN